MPSAHTSRPHPACHAAFPADASAPVPTPTAHQCIHRPPRRPPCPPLPLRPHGRRMRRRHRAWRDGQVRRRKRWRAASRKRSVQVGGAAPSCAFMPSIGQRRLNVRNSMQGWLAGRVQGNLGRGRGGMLGTVPAGLPPWPPCPAGQPIFTPPAPLPAPRCPAALPRSPAEWGGAKVEEAEMQMPGGAGGLGSCGRASTARGQSASREARAEHGAPA